MHFFEYEAKEIVRKGAIPTSKGGFATTPEQARARAEEVAGPVVIKSRVLTGGRMKAAASSSPRLPTRPPSTRGRSSR